jgi:hypothetical protein
MRKSPSPPGRPPGNVRYGGNGRSNFLRRAEIANRAWDGSRLGKCRIVLELGLAVGLVLPLPTAIQEGSEFQYV